MGFRFNAAPVFVMSFMAGIIFSGCVSYQFVRHVRGAEVMPPDNRLKAGSTTLGEVLSTS
jgi:hypothetical protein